MARATDFTKMTTLRRIEHQWERVNECLYLVEFEGVEQIVQLPILADFLQFDVMLLQAMKGQLCLIIDKNLERL
jgi:hypothetical protein